MNNVLKGSNSSVMITSYIKEEVIISDDETTIDAIDNLANKKVKEEVNIRYDQKGISTIDGSNVNIKTLNEINGHSDKLEKEDGVLKKSINFDDTSKTNNQLSKPAYKLKSMQIILERLPASIMKSKLHLVAENTFYTPSENTQINLKVTSNDNEFKTISKLFICIICPKCKQTCGVLRRNKEICHKCKIFMKYKCLLCTCDTMYAKSGSLYRHIRERHSENHDSVYENKIEILKKKRINVIRYCLKCKKNFDVKDIVSSQTKCEKCGTSLLFQCTKCEKRYEAYPSLKYHLDTKCYIGAYFHCPKCNYKTTKKYILKKHLNCKHVDLTDYKECGRCNKKFKNSVTLKNHENMWCKKPILQCDNCPYKTKQRSSLQFHVQLHMKNINQVIINKNFYDEMKGIDWTKYFSIYCTKCDKSVAKLGLQYPKFCQACGTKLFLQCMKCQKSYNCSSAMIYHLRTKCYQGIQFQCTKCDFTHAISKKVELHIEKVHSVINPTDYKRCHHCDIMYKTHELWKQHTKYCGKKLTFNCKLCPFKSYHKSLLQMHLQVHLIHSNKSSKTFNNQIETRTISSCIGKICLKCNKTCMSRGRSKEKCPKCKIFMKYKCLLCNDKAYTMPSSLYGHVLNYHSVNSDRANKNLLDPSNAFVKCIIIPHKFGVLKWVKRYCVKCDVTITSHFKNDSHCKKCKTNFVFQCMKCNAKYANYNVLYRHLKDNCSFGEKMYCDHCSFSTYVKDRLINHLHLRHMSDPSRQHYYYLRREKQASISTSPNKQPTFSIKHLMRAYCSKCKKQKIVMKRMSQCHQCKTQLTFQCCKCNVKCFTQNDLRLHVNVHIENCVKCQHCGKGFGQPRNLKMHEKVCRMETLKRVAITAGST